MTKQISETDANSANVVFENFFSDYSAEKLKTVLTENGLDSISFKREDFEELLARSEKLKETGQKLIITDVISVARTVQNWLKEIFDFELLPTVDFLVHFNNEKASSVPFNEAFLQKTIKGEIVNFNGIFDLSQSDYLLIFEFFCQDKKTLIGFKFH